MTDSSDESVSIIEIYIHPADLSLVFTAVIFQLKTWESGLWTDKAKIWGHFPGSKTGHRAPTWELPTASNFHMTWARWLLNLSRVLGG